MESGVDLAWQLPDVRPQDDLFRHVNGRWLDTVPIPEHRATCGTLLDLKDATQAQLLDIVQRAAFGTAPSGADSEDRLIGDLYASFHDAELVERLGSTPLRLDLEDIARIDSLACLARTLGRLQRIGVSGAFKISVGIDARQPDRYLLHLSQGGLGLPDESYYRAAGLAGIRDSYLAHLRAMLGLAGLPDAGPAAGRITALEGRIATWHTDRVRARDVVDGYTLLLRGDLERLTPNFAWDAWLDGLGTAAPVLSKLVVRQPGFLRAFSAALTEVPLADWRHWLSWRLIRAMSPLLSAAFANESFAFYHTALTGTPRQPDRASRGLRVVESALGQTLGRRYTASYFPPRSIQLVLGMVAGITDAYRGGIETADWLSAPTKARALAKLAALRAHVGCPDGPTEREAVLIRRDDLVGNVQRVQAAKLTRQLARLGGPVDRARWPITPQTVNAFYDVATNQIFVPAAILQPPFFDPNADAAVNYGAIGAVIGHEIGHAFDDRGSKYDGVGNLAEWWTDADRAAFERRAAVLAAQFSALSVPQAPGQRLNGALTVGETIGDLGGLAMAYRAYLLSLGGRRPAVIGGLSGSQRFFLSWARIWRGKVRDAEMVRRLATDPHAPRDIRCNMIPRHLDEFHEAFDIRPGDGLWLEPADRVRIW